MAVFSIHVDDISIAVSNKSVSQVVGCLQAASAAVIQGMHEGLGLPIAPKKTVVLASFWQFWLQLTEHWEPMQAHRACRPEDWAMITAWRQLATRALC